MTVNGHDVLDFWPMGVVAGTVAIAWGRLTGKVDAVKEEVSKKASIERVDALDSKLDKIDAKLDRLIDNMLEKAS